MSTATTLPTVQNQLVTLFTAALTGSGWSGAAVPVYYTFPGATTDRAMVFFGRLAEGALPPSMVARSDIPVMKAGRKAREETYSLEVSILAEKADTTQASAVAVDSLAFAILGVIDGVLANDPRIGLGTGVIQFAELASFERVGGGPYLTDGGGYGAHVVATVDISARLT